MKKYLIMIEVDEEQLKQIYLDQDENLTERDLPYVQELIKREFDWLQQSGIKLTEIIKEIPTTTPPTLDVPCFCGCCEENEYYQCPGCKRYVSYCFGGSDKFSEYCTGCWSYLEKGIPPESLYDLVHSKEHKD